MSLSNTLFNNLTNKLKLETSLLQKEKFYVKKLLNQVTYLKKLKINDYKNLGVERFGTYDSKEINPQNFMIMYVINISFLKANTAIHVSDVQGNVKLFYSILIPPYFISKISNNIKSYKFYHKFYKGKCLMYR